MATPAEKIDERIEKHEVMTEEAAIGKVRLIGITGLAGTGKDTLAEYIMSRFGAKRLALADPIKAILNSIFGFPHEAWNDRKWKESVLPLIGHSPRVLAQTLGTDWGRALNENIWVSKVLGRWRESMCEFTVIPDVRFDNEAVEILRSGGMVIRVERAAAEPVAMHQSEQGVQDQLIHLSIKNDGTIQELHEAFDRAIVRHVLDVQAQQKQQADANPQ